MSTAKLLFAGITGAALSAGIMYASGTKAEAANPVSPLPGKAIAPPENECQLTKDHSISLADARVMTATYASSANPHHLTYDGNNTLKGWFIDRCIIEDLFRKYPKADGLQLYIGEAGSAYNLVWMASQEYLEAGDTLRENCISLPFSVMDMAASCPFRCPDRNDLP